MRQTKQTMILMHKNVPVASFDFGLNGAFSKMNGFFNRPFMPPGTRIDDTFVEKRVKDWLENRMIPLKRQNFAEYMIEHQLQHPIQFYMDNHGLSLNDAYWIVTEEQYNNHIRWEDVNYFDHQYSTYSGERLLNIPIMGAQNNNSPNFTTNGMSLKMWIKQNGKDYLYKTGTPDNHYQEVFNEVLASEIAYRLGINHVEYELTFLVDEKGKKIPFCKCENFCNKDWEFMCARNILFENKAIGKNGYLGYMEQLNFSDHLYQMITFDYIISNMERDQTNFGLMRDNNTFEILGTAPLFDNGNSLWCNWPTCEIGSEDIAKTFETTHEAQIKLVKNFDWYDPDCLEGIEEFAAELYAQSTIPENIQNKIISQLTKQIKQLNKFVKEFYKQQKELEAENLNQANEIEQLTPEMIQKRKEAAAKQAEILTKARIKSQQIRTENAKRQAMEDMKKQKEKEKREEMIRQKNQRVLQKIKEENPDTQDTKSNQSTNPLLTEESNGFG